LSGDPSHSYQAEGTGIPYLFPILLTSPQELNLYPYVANNPIYEIHNVNTPPFMAGMKRYPLKKQLNYLKYLHGDKTNESCSIRHTISFGLGA
jgi:hypothetical protein